MLAPPHGAFHASYGAAATNGSRWATVNYESHRPWQTTLCRLVQIYPGSFIAH